MSSEKPGCLSALFGFRAKPNSNIAFPYRLENSFLSPAEIAFFQNSEKIGRRKSHHIFQTVFKRIYFSC